MTHCFWPQNEPRIHAQIVEISAPFDCGQTVEIKLSINNRPDLHGEIVWRVPVGVAHQYKIGDVYSSYFRLV